LVVISLCLACTETTNQRPVATEKAAPVAPHKPQPGEGAFYDGFPASNEAYLVAHPTCRKKLQDPRETNLVAHPTCRKKLQDPRETKCWAGMSKANFAYAAAHPESDDGAPCNWLGNDKPSWYSPRCQKARAQWSKNMDAADAREAATQHVHVCVNGNCAKSSVWTDANGDIHVSAQKE
jgi:hypothetical protein